jgi:glutamate-5-semialdehyde dehydrogenase
VETSVEELVEREARAARDALTRLTDDGVAAALERAAVSLRDRADDVLSANARDVEAGEGRLDEGALDRLRLDAGRLESIADALGVTAALPPIEREIGSWTLENGLRVSERRIPVGVVGANFEARPNVAVDIASQVLKSGNAVVLRTGGAALGTVTALVDEVLRPALEESGLSGAAVGLVRTPEHGGAHALVSLPDLIPLVILRGSGPSTAELVRRAAAEGVRTLAHAEGGGVLYVAPDAAPEKLAAIVDVSLDRLGVCNRLNLVLVDADARALAPRLIDSVRARGVSVVATRRAALPDVPLLDRRIGHEWAGEAGRVATVTLDVVDDLDEAVRIANEDTSGLAAGIVTEDEQAAARFLDGYRGTASYWNATTRFTDGFVLLGTPETGINVDRSPGPRGPVTYRDLWLRQYRVVGDGTQAR